ncbi:MAG: hypothetical protein V2A78_08010 [bacterium]
MQLKEILELAALILSVVNALILIQNYLRDRPSLSIDPVHPDVYQWWFQLPDGEYNGNLTRRYGFLVYAGIGNRGLKKVALKSWRLFIKTHAQRIKQELKPMTIPEPALKLGDYTKVFSVFGLTGLFSTGETVIESGCSISGWSYFLAEYYGAAEWNPIIKNNVIKGEFVVRDVFGGRAKAEITFTKKDFSFISEMLPGIEKIGEPPN